MTGNAISLVDHQGRKYLTSEERARFIAAASREPKPEYQTFALTLAHSGARISDTRNQLGAHYPAPHEASRRLWAETRTADIPFNPSARPCKGLNPQYARPTASIKRRFSEHSARPEPEGANSCPIPSRNRVLKISVRKQ